MLCLIFQIRADLPDQGNEDEAANFGFAAEDIGDVLFFSLQWYSRNFSSLLFLTGDNAAVNVRLANLITSALRAQGNDVLVPLVGCANHRLNLAVKLLFKSKEYDDLVDAVRQLMKDLRSMKNRYKLAVHTSISPEIDNETRWGSQLKILLSFIALYEFLSMCAFSDKTIGLIPNATQKRQIESLIKDLTAQEKRSVLQFLKNAPDQAASRNEERKEEAELSFIERMRVKDAQ